MEKQPLVSIITPSFNQAKYLEKTIQSVLTQDYPKIEYIICDGGSEDNSVEIIRKYSDRIASWTSERDHGQVDAINKGFNQAHGDILAWLNSDDTYEPGAVSAAVDYLVQNPQIGFVYGDCNFIDSDGNIIGKFNARQTNLKKLQSGYVHIPQQSFFFRADLWKKVGPLDDSFYFAMDYDLWVRLARITQFHYLHGQTWANFRLHDDAKTIAADARCWPEMLRVHLRDGGSRFSLIFAKYYLRRVLAPWITWNRKRKFHKNR